jgi:hypothetical protein
MLLEAAGFRVCVLRLLEDAGMVAFHATVTTNASKCRAARH